MFKNWRVARKFSRGLGEQLLDVRLAGREQSSGEAMAVTGIEDAHLAIVRSYLKAAGKKHGLILNFGRVPLEIKRVLAP